VARMVERRGAYRVFWWGYLKGKRPLGRPRRRWEDNIKTNFKNKSIGRGVDLSG